MTKSIVPFEVKNAAIMFLFPNIFEHSEMYYKINKFIDSEFSRLGTCVLYYLNADFVDLLSESGLEIGKKEVVINNGAVLATSDCHCSLEPILTFHKFYFVLS